MKSWFSNSSLYGETGTTAAVVSRRRFSFGTFCPEVSAGDEIPQGKLGPVQLVHQPRSDGGNAKGRNEERKDEERDPAHRLPADEQDQGEQRQHDLLIGQRRLGSGLLRHGGIFYRGSGCPGGAVCFCLCRPAPSLPCLKVRHGIQRLVSWRSEVLRPAFYPFTGPDRRPNRPHRLRWHCCGSAGRPASRRCPPFQRAACRSDPCRRKRRWQRG